MSVIVVGIDGLDPQLVRAWAESLPNLSELLQNLQGDDTLSVFPPDSIPAWATIFSGLEPAEHGVMGHVDYLAATASTGVAGGWAHVLQGHTFWDEVSKAGGTVLVVNPFIAYPAWHVNGTMVSGPVGDGPVTACPREAYDQRSSNPVIGGIADFPGAHVTDGFLDRTFSDIDALTSFVLRQLDLQPYDLTFVSYLQLDRLGHFLWRYMDTGDPTYPGETRFANSLRLAYEVFDRVVGDYRKRIGADDTVIVFSDHGQGRRCEKVVQVNEVLRGIGFLRPKARKESWLDRRYATERAKSAVLRFAYRHALEEQVFQVARRLPNRAALKTSDHVISSSENVAKASHIGGTNPFGGIVVNRTAAEAAGFGYEDCRDRVIEALAALRDTEGSCPLVWAARREDIVSGAGVGAFPDVLFELRPQYGVGFSLYDGIIGPNTMHRRISGGHRRAAYFGAAGLQTSRRPSRLEDIASLIVDAVSGAPSRQHEGV